MKNASQNVYFSHFGKFGVGHKHCSLAIDGYINDIFFFKWTSEPPLVPVKSRR